MPKLQAGCSTQVMKDGMVVRTDVPEVEEAQKGMMEFFLINHPLDCPICDQAGECGLQDYSFKHGVAYSRFQYRGQADLPRARAHPAGRQRRPQHEPLHPVHPLRALHPGGGGHRLSSASSTAAPAPRSAPSPGKS